MDEVECICANLIYRKYVKGYISHKNKASASLISHSSFLIPHSSFPWGGSPPPPRKEQGERILPQLAMCPVSPSCFARLGYCMAALRQGVAINPTRTRASPSTLEPALPPGAELPTRALPMWALPMPL